LSNKLRHYTNIQDGGDGVEFKDEICADMSVIAYVGPGGMACVQFSIGGKSCCLAPNQQRDLIRTLFKRMKNEKGYTPTEFSECKTVVGLENMSRLSRKLEKSVTREKLTEK
jgi:hypothetical protein